MDKDAVGVGAAVGVVEARGSGVDDELGSTETTGLGEAVGVADGIVDSASGAALTVGAGVLDPVSAAAAGATSPAHVSAATATKAIAPPERA